MSTLEGTSLAVFIGLFITAIVLSTKYSRYERKKY